VWNNPEVTIVLSGMNVDEHIDEKFAIVKEAYTMGKTFESKES